MMISFTCLTTTPEALTDQLVAHGILKLENGKAIAAREGVEIVEIPGPDARHCFMVKVSGPALADEIADVDQVDADGETKPLTERTKLGRMAAAKEDKAAKSEGMLKISADFWLVDEAMAATIGVWQ